MQTHTKSCTPSPPSASAPSLDLSRAEMKRLPPDQQKLWIDAELKEWHELESAGTFSWVSTDRPKQLGAQIISSKFAYKQKPDRAKARLCVRGFWV